MVDEPQGAIYGGEVAAPAFQRSALRPAVPAHRAGLTDRAGAHLSCTAMTLRELFGEDAARPVEVTALAYDNRRVEPGTLFFCVRGFTRDGHDFAADAVARGAVALVVDHPLGLGVPEVVVEDVRAAMAPAAARLHGDPTATLRDRRRHRARTARPRPPTSCARCSRPRASRPACSGP